MQRSLAESGQRGLWTAALAQRGVAQIMLTSFNVRSLNVILIECHFKTMDFCVMLLIHKKILKLQHWLQCRNTSTKSKN